MKNGLYVVGNWKEYPESVKDAQKIAAALSKNRPSKNVTAVVCPPHPFLESVGGKIKKGKYNLGAQDLSPMVLGAYTGEVSPKALTSLGVKYAIIGHSERRALGEEEPLILQKIRSALSCGITPILCVGERSRDNAEVSHSIVAHELLVLSEISKKDVEKIIIAYEPIWAIGTKASAPATAEDAREMRIYIQKVLADTVGEKTMKHIPILYGGSVTPKNAKEYIAVSGMHGLLVGRASLDPKSFISILESIQ